MNPALKYAHYISLVTGNPTKATLPEGFFDQLEGHLQSWALYIIRLLLLASCDVRVCSCKCYQDRH